MSISIIYTSVDLDIMFLKEVCHVEFRIQEYSKIHYNCNIVKHDYNLQQLLCFIMLLQVFDYSVSLYSHSNIAEPIIHKQSFKQ